VTRFAILPDFVHRHQAFYKLLKNLTTTALRRVPFDYN
jgi:hypothetical protein